ncbi:MAG: hypothetical protein A3G34_12230 [Candidatus Lindowbacteria bacterium RIFCSPLOWO2_12_FULL_62_27]|nr:MAG: hypothetical protein A3G34_12230 [Candidatus Lindowbacteria bacterium RIFCSPLOWO2_12_FULL_62_27]
MAAEHLESAGFEVEQAGGGREALEILKVRTFDLAVFDLKMPDMSGLDLLTRVKSDLPEIEVLILTAHGGVDTAVEAIRRGAHHYLVKPIKLAELQAALERAAEKTALNRRQAGETAVRAHRQSYRAGEFLATGPRTRELLETTAHAAAGAFPVLIEGETGTGKELLAQFVHRRSPRHQGPMVAVNCGLLSESLLERELFGHSRGAFTGASDSRAGLFEAADGGTLFLDEIGEASPNVQVALLRAIETGMFRRIGEVRERFADVRIVAASNQPLAKSAETGRFRTDLYHRLNVVNLRIPPLRERPEEIVPLAETFLSRLWPESRFLDDARAALQSHPWPGNVRELQNAIERTVYLCRAGSAGKMTGTVTAQMLGLTAAVPPPGPAMDLDGAERAHIQATILHFNGDKRAAAGALGITLRHLYRKLKKHDLSV